MNNEKCGGLSRNEKLNKNVPKKSTHCVDKDFVKDVFYKEKNKYRKNYIIAEFKHYL